MSKLIIENRTELTDLEAITLVGKVISQGRVSNNGKQYCYSCIVTNGGYEYTISTYLNKGSDRFVISASLDC